MKIEVSSRNYVNSKFYTGKGVIEIVNGSVEIPDDFFTPEQLAKFVNKTNGRVVEINVKETKARKSWTQERIMDFAKARDIELPDAMDTKAKQVAYINEILDSVE